MGVGRMSRTKPDNPIRADFRNIDRGYPDNPDKSGQVRPWPEGCNLGSGHPDGHGQDTMKCPVCPAGPGHPRQAAGLKKDVLAAPTMGGGLVNVHSRGAPTLAGAVHSQ